MQVAIVDDVADELEVLEYELEDAGHKAIRRESPIASLDNLDSWLRAQQVEGFVCDQRLSVANYAPFQGAEAVRRVFRHLRLPSLLVSSFIATEVLAIRYFRASVPVLIEKQALGRDTINRGFALSKSELGGNVPTQRIPRRTGVHITKVDVRGRGIVETIVPGWNENLEVSFPLDLIEDHTLRTDVRSRRMDWLIARVNLDAEHQADLFFMDFERAPDPGDVWERLWRPS